MLGQGALVLAAPVLSRLYDPEAFGLLSVYAAVLSVLLAVASLRFDLAIPIAADPREAFDLLVLSVLLGLGTSAALALVVLLWGPQLAAAMGAAPITPYLWLLPVALFIAGCAQALGSWAVYHRLYPALGRMRATQGVVQATGQVVLGLLQAGPFGLILGDIAGRVAGVEHLLSRALTTLRATELSFRDLVRRARERWGFARVMTAASLLSALSLQVPFLLIPPLFDLASAGQYFLAYRVLILPASLVGAAVSQVFFGEASFRRDDVKRLEDLARNAAASLFAFSIPTYTIVIVGGPTLIEAVFGGQWALAGLYAQIMAPSLIIWSVASPISSLLLVGRREVESLAFTAVSLALEAGAFLIGAWCQSLTAALVFLSATSVLTNGAALWRFLRVAHVGLRQLAIPVARILLLTLPSLALVALVVFLAPGGILPAAALGWMLAVLLSARFSPEFRALLSGSHD